MPVPFQSQRCRHRAFTLIELLVVVAIIAILLSILLPSMKMARVAAKRAVCAANLHSVGVSLGLYVQDLDGDYPPGNATIGRGHGIDSTYVVPWRRPYGMAFLITASFATDPRIFYCPSWRHPWNQYDKVDVEGRDRWFGRNHMGGWPADPNGGPTAHRSFAYHYRSSFGSRYNEPPSQSHNRVGGVAVVTDHFSHREVLYGRDYGHRHGYNVLYLDNSVMWVPDPDSKYMSEKQPGFLTNGNWGLQERIWLDFFDQ